MSKIPWKNLDETDFNRAAEALLVAECTGNGMRAHAIDGRGGDGGIDIDVHVERTGQLTQIFQLKHFPEGFSGGFKQRRTQIEKSFLSAVDKNPSVWTLVFPGNPTVQERKFVFGLRGGRDVLVRIVGVAELDGLLSKHPNLENYLSRNEAIEALKAIHRPEALLARPGDLNSEMKRLKERIDGRSQYWTTAVSLLPDGSLAESLHPKREDASQREPLRISFDAVFDANDEALRKQLEDKLKYGGSGTVALPQRVIKEFRKEGPEWFAEVATAAEIQISSLGESVSEPTVIEIYDANGAFLSQLRGTTTTIDRGFGGTTIENSFYGGLDFQWQFSDKLEEGGRVTFNFDPADSTPRETRAAIRFIESFQEGAELWLTVQGRPTIKVGLSGSALVQIDSGLKELIEDLCAIEEKLDLNFRFSLEGIDLSDRIWARVLVRLLAGKPVAQPFQNSIAGTLSGVKSEGLERLLDGESALVVDHPDWAIHMFGQKVRLGKVRLYSHHVEVDDRRSIQRKLEAGTTTDVQVRIRPVHGQPFVVYAPAFLSDAPDAVVLTHPWGLTGVPEHPKYHALPNKVRSAFERPPKAPGNVE